MKTLEPFHSALWSALNDLELHLLQREIVLVDPFYFPNAFSDGVQYGHTREAHAEIKTVKNKATKKYAHVTIWRDGKTGRYEINFYIL